ncbi:LysR family transcriptional regulator [Aquicoccus porphyridii]|nr:LysR substrate-binding domain-containing protein [Aquicoccus porphyridii]
MLHGSAHRIGRFRRSFLTGARWHSRLTIRHFRMIDSLERLGLVARVAEALNVTQPAVSKQIADLEQIVGSPIVLRERNRLYLTPVGLRLAKHARLVLAQIERAALDIDGLAAGISGAVAVGAVGSVAPTLLPRAIAFMNSVAPNVNLSVIEGHFVSMLPLLNDNSIDFLIARSWQPQEYSGIAQTLLYEERLRVVAGPKHPLTRARNVSWPDVVSWPWVFSPETSVARQGISSLFAQYGLATPERVTASISLTLNMALMKEMNVLTLFPEELAKAHALRGDLAILPLDAGNLLSEVRCYWRSDRPTDKSKSLFLHCIEQSAAQRNE